MELLSLTHPPFCPWPDEESSEGWDSSLPHAWPFELSQGFSHFQHHVATVWKPVKGDQPQPHSCLFVLILAFSSALFIRFWPLHIDNRLVIPLLLTSLGTLSSSQLVMIVSSRRHPTPPTRLQSLKSPPTNISFPSLLLHKCLGWEDDKTKDKALGNTNLHQNSYGRKRKKKQSTSFNSGLLGQTNT